MELKKLIPGTALAVLTCFACATEKHVPTTGGSGLSEKGQEVARQMGRDMGKHFRENVVPLIEKMNAQELRGQAIQDLAGIGNRLQTHAMRHGGNYPESFDDLDPVPGLDPHGTSYVYKFTGGFDFELWYLGADGKEGGEGMDADLSYQMVINGQR